MNHKLAWVWKWDKLEVELNVPSTVADFFNEYRQKKGEHERGGQLFVDVNSEDGLWLSEATSPHKDDFAGPTWLHLDPKRCKKEILTANQQGLILVGYWHTHPESIPSLSPQDISSFRKFSLKNVEYLSCPLAVIVGNGQNADSIRAWSLQSNDFILGSIIKNNFNK